MSLRWWLRRSWRVLRGKCWSDDQLDRMMWKVGALGDVKRERFLRETLEDAAISVRQYRRMSRRRLERTRI